MARLILGLLHNTFSLGQMPTAAVVAARKRATTSMQVRCELLCFPGDRLEWGCPQLLRWVLTLQRAMWRKLARPKSRGVLPFRTEPARHPMTVTNRRAKLWRPVG
jgi:hypothetical protein